VAAVSGLFLTGVLFGYFIMCPLSVWFLSTYSISDMIVNEFDITSYVSTMSMLILGGGLVFQLPVVMYFLTRVGVVTPAFLRKYRKHAVILILVVGAIITPPDPLSQMLISTPLYLLYELSIFISAMVMRQKEREEKAAQAGS
jgi:sec-independent protein translocase protein TatC